jgi:hypothetical protein
LGIRLLCGMIGRVWYFNLGCLLNASTTYQTLFIVSVWTIPYVVIMSYTEPPANHHWMAHARRTSGGIGPFGTCLSSGVFNVFAKLVC